MMEHPGNSNRKPLQFLEFKEPGEGKVWVKTREVLICKRSFSTWQKLWLWLCLVTDRTTARQGGGWGMGVKTDHSLLLPFNLLLVLPISWNQSQSKKIVMEITTVNFLGCKQGRKEWWIYDTMIKYRYSNFVLHITSKRVCVCAQSCTTLCNPSLQW